MADDEKGDASAEEFSTPSTACDEKKKDGFIYVIVGTKGLTTSSDIVFKGVIPKKKRKPANAKVDVVFENESFCLTVRGESGGMKEKKLQLKINKLPHEIIPEESYHEVEKDRILLYLCKKEKRSWYPELSNGLETAEDTEN